MAGPSLREGSPQGGASAETSGAVTGIPAIVVLLALGLILRLIIAYVLLPGSGFPNDLGAFQYWGNDIAQNGPVGFYARTGFIDYPPVYLLLLGAVSLLTGGNIGEGVKLLPILADIGIAALVWRMALDMGVTSRRALIAAAIVVLNPVTWFNSSIWGQADAVGTLFMLLGLRELQKDHREAASAMAVVAVMTKLQLGILGFLVGFVVLRRSLFPKTGQAEPERVLSSVGAGLATGALICLPFTGLDFGGAIGRIATGSGLLTIAAGLIAGVGVFFLSHRFLRVVDPAGRAGASVLLGLGTAVAFSGMVFDAIAEHVINAFGEYPFVTVNAYNPWALVSNGRAEALDLTDAWWVLHDAPWSDASSGASGPGFVITFPADVLIRLLVVAAFLGSLALIARLVSRFREGSSVPAAPDAGEDAGGSRGLLTGLADEFGGLWTAFLVAAVVIVAAVALSATGSLYAAELGGGLLIVVILVASIWAARRDDAPSLLVALAVMAIAFFVVPTRAHERYLFPFFGVGAVLLAVSWRWTWVYVALAAANAANLLGVLVEYSDPVNNTGIPVKDGAIAGMLLDWGRGILEARLDLPWFGDVIWPIWLCGVITGLAMIWALLQLRPRAVAALAREVAEANLEPESGTWWSRLGPADAYGAPRLAEPAMAVSGAGYGRAQGAADAHGYEEEEEWGEEEYGPEPLYVPRSVMNLWHRLARQSTYPDRSASLDSEPRGRFDKLDIWIAVALILAILSLRVYRLGEPQQMHFDEVYHARTATEFLQDQRYGIPHNIYEWTHPHLAKYAIGVGITNFSDFTVTATGSIGVPVEDAVVQPRTEASPLTSPIGSGTAANGDARYGDRVFVATGSDVRVYDLESRALVQVFSIPGASAFSGIGATGLVYVGTSDGRIYEIDTNALDDVRNGAAQAAAPPLELGVSTGWAISHVYSGTPPFILAADAAGNMATVDLNRNGGTIVAHGFVSKAADFSDLGAGAAALMYTPPSTPTPSPTETPTPTPTPTPTLRTHVVGPGDSLISIAAEYGVTWEAIYAANRAIIGDNPDFILDGTVLVIPWPATSPGPSATPTTTPTPSESPTPTPTPSGSLTEAEQLANALGLSLQTVERAMSEGATPGVPHALDVGLLATLQIEAVRNLVAQGLLPDIQVEESSPQVMVAYESGIGTLDPQTLAVSSTIATDAPATSIAINYADFQGSVIRSDQSCYVAAGDSIVLIHVDQSGSPWTVSKDRDQRLKKMPGLITKVYFDRATRVAEALGRTPDGTGWTVYAIETNGNAVFSDARLPFEPVALGLDSTPRMPDVDREQMLAFAADGSMATVDVGQFAFGWRIMGVLFGTLMAVCLYLLVRLLFRRRTIGLLAALFSLTDGMLFVQSRIAMNDTYVGGLLLLGYLIFALLWLNAWKSRRVSWAVFWAGMPVLGVVLGLALAAKWVAAYAIASICMLILVRSALGRLITIVGMAAATGVLGWMAIGEMVTMPDTGDPAVVVLFIGLAIAVVVGGFAWALAMRATPDKVLIGIVTALIAAVLFAFALIMSPASLENGAPNYTFFLIMLTATTIGAAANAYHPVAWTREELVFAIGAPIVLGGLAGLCAIARLAGLLPAFLPADTLSKAGLAGILGGPLVALAFRFAGTLGFGPLASPPAPGSPASYAGPPSPAPTGWLRLGSGFGLPAAWMAACLLVLPIVVYVAMYIPWAMPWHPQTAESGPLPVIACWHFDTTAGVCDDAWPAGHTGQTLWDLTFGTYGMYDYHNTLRQPHPASSPWWAFPLDLKPVWFENANYAGDAGTMIYDGGNPAIWWLAIFGMAFATWQAFKRRSLGLTLVVVAFFWQWLSWSRIDRATFQYHFYTALPFFLAALAYFLAELWHGPSRRTWLLARVAGASALIFPAAAWLLKYPLCGLARVGTSEYYGNSICGTGTGDVVIETRILMIAIVLILALIALALVLWRLERRQDEGAEDPLWIGQLVVPVIIAGVLLWWLGQNGPRDVIFQAALPSEGIALVLLPILAVIAFVALTARNPRRYVLGACGFIVVAFLALYPNLSALPMPGNIVSAYNALLPTWFYGFQFSVNEQQSARVEMLGIWSIMLAMLTLLAAGFAAWAAWERRIVVGFRRRRLLSDGAETSTAADPGSAGPAGSD